MDGSCCIPTLVVGGCYKREVGNKPAPAWQENNGSLWKLQSFRERNRGQKISYRERNGERGKWGGGGEKKD